MKYGLEGPQQRSMDLGWGPLGKWRLQQPLSSCISGVPALLPVVRGCS